MKQVLLAVAAAGLALTSSAARATTIHFTFDTGAGITLDGTIDETGGVAISGWGTITSPFWTTKLPFVLLPSGNPSGSGFSDRFGDGTDLIGDAVFNPANNPPVDDWGPIFAVGNSYTPGKGVGFNFWANNPGNSANPDYQWFFAGNLTGGACAYNSGNTYTPPDNCIYDEGRSGTLTSDPVPEPTTLTILGIGLAGLTAIRRRKSA
jgi:PEP-CTERM motif